MSTILDSLAERLGDAKPLIRNAALNAVEAIQTVITPRRTVLLLKGGLTHKNFRVRESVLQVIVGYEESQHDQELLTTILSQVVPLLDDSNSAVREQASKYLQICYRTDRSLRNSIINLATRASHTSYLLSKFDEIDASMFKVDPEAQRLAPEVKPIFVSTEAELRHHMSGVDKIMSKEGSWEEKVSGMLLLTAILLGGATKVKGFGAMLKVLEESIHSQIREMRSSVIKEACSLVSLLSKQMGSGFSSYADVYIPTLLKQTCVTIQIISDSCDYCIQTILRNTPVGSNIMSLLTSSAATASHKVIRQKCTIYIRQLLEDRTLHYLDKYIDSIEHTINKTVYDADGQVRMTARRCFSAFASRWPERRDKLFYGFEASIQNTITKEEANPAALEPPAPRKGSSTPTRFDSALRHIRLMAELK
jgi:CLIP-associating protein 1/2